MIGCSCGAVGGVNLKGCLQYRLTQRDRLLAELDPATSRLLDAGYRNGLFSHAALEQDKVDFLAVLRKLVV